MSLASVLFLIFLVLKLAHVVAWSWWAVTAPLWVGGLLWLALFLIMGAAVGAGSARVRQVQADELARARARRASIDRPLRRP